MKTFAIRRTYSYIEINSSEVNEDSFDQKLEELDSDIKTLHDNHGVNFICTDTRFISSDKMSVRVCESCQNLMINRDKNPAGFDSDSLWKDAVQDTTLFILNGGTHAGKELCMECLPPSHRWGLFS
jgi:hypothetical protein